MGYGLGRRAAQDNRDKHFPLRATTVSVEPKFPYRYWAYPTGPHLDQGQTSSCVGHAAVHFLECAPITHPTPGPVLDPFYVYREAQKIDEWPGEEPAYEGTSVRAGMRVLQREGWIGEYRWAWTLDEVVRHVWTTGPVVMGTDWVSSFFYPDAMGFVQLGNKEVVGGHAWLIDGVNMQTRTIRGLNSWGENWGTTRGRFRMEFDTLDWLLQRDGEAATCVELSQP